MTSPSSVPVISCNLDMVLLRRPDCGRKNPRIKRHIGRVHLRSKYVPPGCSGESRSTLLTRKSVTHKSDSTLHVLLLQTSLHGNFMQPSLGSEAARDRRREEDHCEEDRVQRSTPDLLDSPAWSWIKERPFIDMCATISCSPTSQRLSGTG